MENMFLKAAKPTYTLTENGALTNLSTNSVLADQFGKAANYRGRNISEVFADQNVLWEDNAEAALRFPFYLRMVTRKTKIGENNITETVQKGQGARDESFKRLLWIAVYHPEIFYKNIFVLPLVGSWKDIWMLMYLDKSLNVNCLDHKIMFELIGEGLKSNVHTDLIKKFMPRIKTNTKCTTEWTKCMNELAKEFANLNKMSYMEYNHLKTSGTAHDFQKKICSRDYEHLKWNRIPGRALNLLTKGKFLKNHDLEKDYTEWLIKQPTAKFTGYVYELGHDVVQSMRGNTAPLYKRMTWDKQFEELIAKASDTDSVSSNVLCAIDTSGSMQTQVVPNVSAYDICISLGVFFATLNKGAFHNTVAMFDDTSTIKQLDGTFSEKIEQIVNERTAWGSTSFESLINLLVKVRKEQPNIPLEDYPTTILVVSDMQFNSWWNKTNFEASKERLAEAFPQEWVDSLKWIWWDLTSRRKADFPATLNDSGNYFLSGFDPSIITMITGENVEINEKVNSTPISMEEVMTNALSQEVLNYLSL